MVLVTKDSAELRFFFVWFGGVKDSTIFRSCFCRRDCPKDDFINHLSNDLLFGFIHDRDNISEQAVLVNKRH